MCVTTILQLEKARREKSHFSCWMRVYIRMPMGIMRDCSSRAAIFFYIVKCKVEIKKFPAGSS